MCLLGCPGSMKGERINLRQREGEDSTLSAWSPTSLKVVPLKDAPLGLEGCFNGSRYCTGVLGWLR